MNHNQSPDDLSAALHGIANGVNSGPPSASDSDFATTVRIRTLAVRRRRRNQRIGIVTSCLALVAVGGVVLVQNLPGAETPSTPIASQPVEDGNAPTQGGAFPACGAAPDLAGGARPLTLVSGRHSGDDGVLADHAAGDDDAFFTDFTTSGVLPLQVRNNSDETLTVGSTGYARFVIVQDGVVVAEPDGMPEPYTSPTLEPGEMASVSQTGIAACSGSELPDGDYEAYALLDVQVSAGTVSAGSDGEAEDSLVYGGPWKVRFGETTVSLDATSQHCGEQISETPRLNAIGLLDGTDNENETQVAFRPVLEHPERLRLESFETYLVADGTVVASTTPGESMKLDLTSIELSDFPVPSTSCDGETPVPPGDYQFFAILTDTDTETGKEMDIIFNAKDVTVTAK